MPETSKWVAAAQIYAPDIPQEAVERVAPGMDALLQAFRPLLAAMGDEIEPAVTLSEAAVVGESEESET